MKKLKEDRRRVEIFSNVIEEEGLLGVRVLVCSIVIRGWVEFYRFYCFLEVTFGGKIWFSFISLIVFSY